MPEAKGHARRRSQKEKAERGKEGKKRTKNGAQRRSKSWLRRRPRESHAPCKSFPSIGEPIKWQLLRLNPNTKCFISLCIFQTKRARGEKKSLVRNSLYGGIAVYCFHAVSSRFLKCILVKSRNYLLVL